MRRSVIIWIISMCGMISYAQQFPFELWHDGRMVLDNGDTLRGSIKYDLQNDILQLQANQRVESFTARKVLFFEIFDTTVKRYRMFYSLPYSQAGGDYKAPVFFELLEEGKITLLCREALEYRTYNNSFYYYGTFQRLELVNKFFLLRENGTIEEFRGKKNDWYQIMTTRSEDVQQYAKANKFNLEDKYGLANVVAYYNSFFKNK